MTVGLVDPWVYVRQALVRQLRSNLVLEDQLPGDWSEGVAPDDTEFPRGIYQLSYNPIEYDWTGFVALCGVIVTVFSKDQGEAASLDSAATALAIRESIDEITAIRGDRPVSAEELAVGVAALTRGYARNFETLDQIARAVAQIALFDLPDDYYSQFVPRIEAVTPDQVTEVAARHLDPDRLTTVIVGDLDQFGQNLGQLDLGQPALLTADSI